MNKYKNRNTVVDGIRFDSKREAERYKELKLMESAGIIKDLVLQPVYELQPKFKYNGMTERAVTYRADFKYIEIESGATVVEDVKGVETVAFKIKRKLLLYKYPELDFRIIK